MKYLWIVGVMVLVVACGNGDKAQISGSSSRQKVEETVEPLAEVPRDDYQLHADNATLPGSNIAFLREDDLYIANIDGSPATLIANNIVLKAVAPHNQMLLYSDETGIYRLDIATGQAEPINPPSSGVDIDAQAWSPNGQYVVVKWLDRNGAGLTRWIIDIHGKVFELPKLRLPIENNRAVHWLQDNRLLTLSAEDSITMTIIDPEDGMTTNPDDPAFAASRIHSRLISDPADCPNCASDLRQIVSDNFQFRLANGPLNAAGRVVMPESAAYKLALEFDNERGDLCEPIKLALESLVGEFLPALIYEDVAADTSQLVLNDETGYVTMVQSVSQNCDYFDVRQQVVQIKLEDPYPARLLYRSPKLGSRIPESTLITAPDHTYILWSSNGRLILTSLGDGATQELMAFSDGTVTPLAWH